MAIRIDLDEALRIAHVRIDGPSSGHQVSAQIVDAVEARSALAGWDWIHDVRQASGETGLADVARVAAVFQKFPHTRPEALTIFITFDPSFALWARTMDPLFPRRRHLVATSLEGAAALLRTSRAARN